MSEKLKPCPFCGEVKDLYEGDFTVGPTGGGEGDYHEEHRVECQNCGALGPWADTRIGAIREWNRRKVEEEK